MEPEGIRQGRDGSNPAAGTTALSASFASPKRRVQHDQPGTSQDQPQQDQPGADRDQLIGILLKEVETKNEQIRQLQEIVKAEQSLHDRRTPYSGFTGT